MEVEDLFSSFVGSCQSKDASGPRESSNWSDRPSGAGERTGRYEAQTPAPLGAEGVVHLLTRRKSSPPAANDASADRISRPLLYAESALDEPDDNRPKSPLDIATRPDQITARDLDEAVRDLSTRVNQGELEGVHDRITELRKLYPRDLLLLRRISEIYADLGDQNAAMECLFRIVALLFERREFGPMREVLEQILVMKPEHPQALKLQSLVEARFNVEE